MNPTELYYSWLENENVQNKPFITFFTFIMGYSVLNMKQTEPNFFTKLSTCNFQVRWQSRYMPKSLIFSVIVRDRLLYAMCNGYVRNLEEVNFTINVLFKLSTNWLFWNHSEILRSTEFTLEFNSLWSLEETRILVPSAKRMVWETLFMMHGKSLIYTLNSNGLKTDPWGTPCLTISQSERR